MADATLFSVSPLDGRYAKITAPLRDYFSEAAYIRYRVNVEIDYLIDLSQAGVIRRLTAKELKLLKSIPKLKPPDYATIKTIEQTTHHDVKAIEYYLRGTFHQTSLQDLIPFLHICLTSEDINNLAYRLMVKDAQTQVILPCLHSVISHLSSVIKKYASLPMLARTHGQPAVPTTLGKELAVFASRLLIQAKAIQSSILTGKLNGAVGTFAAHQLMFPQVHWPRFSQTFIKHLGLTPSLVTTQINPPDDLISLLHHYHLTNSILIDLCQDIWRYISDDWLVQTGKTKRIGSSTMPQKINPIEFENAEGNLELANGLIETLARKLPQSRLQRDLADSTVLRNLGVVFGHSLIAYSSLNQGLAAITPNPEKITADLNHNYAILGEALQTYLRTQGKPDAYESVAKAFKHKVMTQSDWQAVVRPLAPKLVNLTPKKYLGLSQKLALQVNQAINSYLKGSQ